MPDLKPKPAPRLYLVTPPVSDPAAFARPLGGAVAAADVAAVLLRLSDSDERSQINCIKTLAPLVQDKDVALVIDGHPDLVARGGADGAHLTGIDAFSAALDTLGERIAGCGGLGSRHDAMLAGEHAHYVMFGDPVDGRRPSLDAIIERIEWWAPIFQVPCVALAMEMDEIGPLAAAGADFIALGDFVWSAGPDVAATVSAAAQRLKAAETMA